jgi:hypothetical protein
LKEKRKNMKKKKVTIKFVGIYYIDLIFSDKYHSKQLYLNSDETIGKNYSAGIETVLGDIKLFPGKKYIFEFQILKGNEFGIGICPLLKQGYVSNSLLGNGPYSEYWAYRSTGEKIHNERSEPYAQLFAQNDIITVYLDLIHGGIHLSLF